MTGGVLAANTILVPDTSPTQGTRGAAEPASPADEARRAAFFDRAPVPLASVDPEGRVEVLNRRFVRELGYGLSDIPTVERWRELAYPDPAYRAASREAWNAAIAEARASGREVEAGEHLVTRKDGSVGIYLIGASLVEGYLLASFVDVSGRKRAEAELAESVARYRALSEVSPAGIWQIDAEGRTVYVNPAMRRFFGLAEGEEAAGRHFREFIAPECLERVVAENAKRREGRPSTYEACLLARDGSRREVIAAGSPFKDAQGRYAGSIAIYFDLTEPKRSAALLRAAEEEARERERSLREQNDGLLDLLFHGPLLAGDFGEAVRSVTELAARLSRTRRAGLWFYSEDDSALRCVDLFDLELASHSSGEEIRSADFPAYTAAHRRGEIVAVRDVAADPLTKGMPTAYSDAHGVVSLLDAPVRLGLAFRGVISLESVGAVREWSSADERLATLMATAVSLAYQAEERKRAREEAAKGEEALRAVVEAAPYSIVIQRKSDGVYLYVNAAFLEANGYADPSEVVGRGYDEVARLEPSSERERMSALLHEGGRLDGYQHEVRRDGELRHQAVYVRSIAYRGEDCYVAIVMDITELKRAEDELKRLNAELERKVAERTEDLAHTNLELQAVNAGLSKAMEELKAAQGAILVSEKLAALGRLIAGIAHELNTPLAAIASSSRLELKHLGAGLEELALAASRLGPEELSFVREARSRAAQAKGGILADPASERAARREAAERLREAGVAEPEAVAEDLVELGAADLAGKAGPLLAGARGPDLLALLRGALGSYRAALVAEDAVGKAVRVVSALRTYARGGDDEYPVAFRLAPELRLILDLYYNRTKRGIAIELAVPEGLEVFGRREALGRVWFNILNNAIQAMGDTGSIEISARAEGGFVELSIADSGPGIPPEIQGRIFEPFFTTKAPGEGTGLGLDIARRLARENGGDISFASRPGRTVFTVSLPAAMRQGGAEP